MGVLEELTASVAALEWRIAALERRLADAPAAPPTDSLVRTYSIADACRALGLSRSKVYMLIQLGELTRIKIGRRSLIERASLERLVVKYREKPKR